MKKIFISTVLIAILLILYYRPLLFALTGITTLEIKVVCTNNPAQQLTQNDANTYLAGSRIIGSAFNTAHYRQCYLLVKKYRSDAPRDEITQAISNIYDAVIGTGGL